MLDFISELKKFGEFLSLNKIVFADSFYLSPFIPEGLYLVAAKLFEYFGRFRLFFTEKLNNDFELTGYFFHQFKFAELFLSNLSLHEKVYEGTLQVLVHFGLHKIFRMRDIQI